MHALSGIIIILALSSLHVQANQDKSVVSPWARNSLDFETGVIWNIGNNTPLSYRIVTNRVSWRMPYVMKKDLSNGSTFVVRTQLSVMADWIDQGPEDYYFGLSAAPSFEWWSPNDKWSIYASIGGGIGITNSQGVMGGQGQDFTFNWFAKSGLRYRLSDDLSVFGGAYFQHISNRGQTDPNPGIDALGFSIGVSKFF
ncbi:MAG: acyloxyacyl hydrolase [Akkermansiaceae bacterium]